MRQGTTLRKGSARPTKTPRNVALVVVVASGARDDVSKQKRSERTIARVISRPTDATSSAAASLERSLALPSEEKKQQQSQQQNEGAISSEEAAVPPLPSTTAFSSSSTFSTSSSPTISLADRKNPGASADELTSTWEHRAWVAGTAALLLALAAQGVEKCLDVEGGSSGGGGLASVAVALGASYLLSDFLTAVYHWSVDNYGDGNTPIVGGQIAAFQGHHQVRIFRFVFFFAALSTCEMRDVDKTLLSLSLSLPPCFRSLTFLSSLSVSKKNNTTKETLDHHPAGVRQ